MTPSPEEAEEFVRYHKDGSVWANGHIIEGVPTGYWEWFRKNGTILRSGYFRDGIQVGEWTTYDASGSVYKVTDMKNGRRGKKTVIERE